MKEENIEKIYENQSMRQKQKKNESISERNKISKYQAS